MDCILALVERAHRGKDVVDGNGALGARWPAHRRLIPDRGPVGCPGCEDCALHFRLEARMARNVERMKKTRKWLRHGCASFPSSRSFLVAADRPRGKIWCEPESRQGGI